MTLRSDSAARPQHGTRSTKTCLSCRAMMSWLVDGLNKRGRMPRPSPFRPLDERGRNLVTHNHDAQDAIVAQQDRGTEPGRLHRGVASPRRREVRRGPAPHGCNQSEHVLNAPIQCLPAATIGDVSNCTGGFPRTCYSRGAGVPAAWALASESGGRMSERNGDRARFQKNRKRKLQHRQRIQALLTRLRKRTAEAGGPTPTGR